MPNDMPGSGRYVQTRVATPTISDFNTPVWRGNSMQQHTVVQPLPNTTFTGKGKGVWSLTETVPPGDARFPRGPRISGRQGTIKLEVTSGQAAAGVRTLGYLTDDLANPDLVILLGIDGSNRPFARVTTPTAASLVAATGVLTLTGNMADVAATGVLTFNSQVNNGDTVTIDSKTYTFQTVLTDSDGNVLIGGTASDSIDNLIAAITLGAGAGTNYATSTTLHPTVTAAAGAGDTMDATAKAAGTEGNSIATTESTSDVRMSWGAGTLTGGDNDTVTIGSKTYRFQTALTNVDGNVLIGGTASDSIDNLIAAITLGAGAGTTYATATTQHPTVTAAAGAGDTMDVSALVPGEGGNSIATTDTSSNASWGDVNLTGGVGSVAAVETTPTGAAIADDTRLSIQLAWDTVNPIDGTRHAVLKVNGIPVPDADWSVDPIAPWTLFQPQFLVLGQGSAAFGSGGVDHNGDYLAFQGATVAIP